MKRLTEKFKDGRNILRKGITDIFHVGFGRFFEGNAVDRLAEYEDLEEQGRLLKLPCAVGDTYYCIDDGTYPNEWEFINVQQIISCMDKIGKTVFLTRPDAERALTEMEGKNGD